MLWQKELINGELVYGQLLTKDIQKSISENFSAKMQFCKSALSAKKSDLLTQQIRRGGNEFFSHGHFSEAVRWYNRAIAAAENNSEDLGICYANRSACLLKLKQYAKCLADIELAKKNKYPVRLMPKLEHRKVECEKLLATDTDVDSQRSEPKLSFEADLKIPCFANGLEVKNSPKYGNHITTNRNLEIGQTVIVERAFLFDTEFDMYCQNCQKCTPHLIPCKKCVSSLFCSEECRIAADEKFHDIFCDLGIICDIKCYKFVLKSIILAIRTFSTIETLMEAVENFRTQNGTEIYFDDPAKRDYFQFFELHTNVDMRPAHEQNRQ